jgi:hypothetical protein
LPVNEASMALTQPWAPVAMWGWGQPTASLERSTGGWVVAPSIIPYVSLANQAAIAPTPPSFIVRPDVVFAWAFPDAQGNPVNGWSVDPTYGGGGLNHERLDASGVADPTERMFDNGYRQPRVAVGETTDPGVNDDETVGWQPGDLWPNESSNAVFVCEDAAAGAAVWQELGSGGSGDKVVSTSATSQTVGTGSKTFTTAAALDVRIGTYIRIEQTSAPSTNWMAGPVTAIAGTSITVLVYQTNGSGTHSDWTLGLTGFHTPVTAAGDLLVGANTSGLTKRLAVGANGLVVMSNGSEPTYQVTVNQVNSSDDISVTGTAVAVVAVACQPRQIGLGDSSLSPEQSFPAWFYVDLDYLSVIAGDQGAGQSLVALFDIPARWFKHVSLGKLNEQYVDGNGDATNILLDVGVTGDDSKFIAGYDIMNSGTADADHSTIDQDVDVEDFGASVTVWAIVTMDAGLIANLTAGQVRIMFMLSKGPESGA